MKVFTKLKTNFYVGRCTQKLQDRIPVNPRQQLVFHSSGWRTDSSVIVHRWDSRKGSKICVLGTCIPVPKFQLYLQCYTYDLPENGPQFLKYCHKGHQEVIFCTLLPSQVTTMFWLFLTGTLLASSQHSPGTDHIQSPNRVFQCLISFFFHSKNSPKTYF